MSTDHTDRLEAAVRQHIADGTGIDFDTLVLEGNPKGDRPKEPYATLLLVHTRRLGEPNYATSADGTTTVENFYRSRFSLQFYRATAVTLAQRYADWCASEAGRDAQLDADPPFAIVSAVDYQREDDDVSDHLERRTLIDLDVEWRTSTTQDGSTISEIASPAGEALRADLPPVTAADGNVVHGTVSHDFGKVFTDGT